MRRRAVEQAILELHEGKECDRETDDGFGWWD
jgi:hypothetical protein